MAPYPKEIFASTTTIFETTKINNNKFKSPTPSLNFPINQTTNIPHRKEKNTIPKDASLICEETVSPNKHYITDEKDMVKYTVRVYQEKNNDIIVYAESNSPLFDEAQYIVICDHAITADDVHIKWTTLMGSTEASEKDEIGLAHVSISKDGEVFNEKTISFVAKAVNAVTDVIG